MNKRGIDIGLFGAFERHNFGDWLMAFCAAELLQPMQSKWLYDFDDLGFGINQSVGNFTKLVKFLNESESPTIIHVGGETLACTTTAAAEMSSQEKTSNFDRVLHYVLPETYNSKKIERYFFGVGGIGVLSLDPLMTKDLANSLNSAKWVSVRDPVSQSNLMELGVKARMHPDIVHVMPRLFPISLQDVKDERKLVFQTSEAILRSCTNQTSEMLFKYFSNYTSIRLVVAGVAPGHDSFNSYLNLIRIVNQRRPNWISILFDINPLNIVKEIASASLVISTSLHFRIVAIAYGIPRISMFVEKSINYGKKWDLDRFSISSFSEVSECLSKIEGYESHHFKELSDLRTKEVFECWNEMLEIYAL